MHAVLTMIDSELAKLSAALKAVLPNNEPLSNAHNVWNNPGTSRDELVDVVDQIAAMIKERGSDQLICNEVLIADYQRRIVFLSANTVPQLWSGNAGQAVSVFLITMQGLQLALDRALPTSKKFVAEVAQERGNVKAAVTRLRALEASISDLEPRSKTLVEMVNRIEQANSAADQLPVDLAALREARKTIEELLGAVSLIGVR